MKESDTPVLPSLEPGKDWYSIDILINGNALGSYIIAASSQVEAFETCVANGLLGVRKLDQRAFEETLKQAVMAELVSRDDVTPASKLQA